MTEVEEKLLEHQSYYNSSVRDCVCTKVPFSEPCCLYGKKFIYHPLVNSFICSVKKSLE